MKLCKCGCGKEVVSSTANYINGHNSRGIKRDVSVLLKREKTVFDKYGVKNVNQLKEIKEKKKITALKHYGTDSHNRDDNVKQKKKNTLLKHYGVNHQLKSKIVQQQLKNTCLIKYGVENPQQLKEIQNQTKETNKERYGVEYFFQSKEAKEKSRKTCLKKYGVDNFAKTAVGRRTSRDIQIRLIENQQFNGEPLTPRIGNLERCCLDELQKLTIYQIQRNVRLIGYFPDGYISELRLIIEFDEKWHNFTFCKKRDIKKNQDYKDNNFNLFSLTTALGNATLSLLNGNTNKNVLVCLF